MSLSLPRGKRIKVIEMERLYEISFMVLGELAVGGTWLLLVPSLSSAGLSFYRTNGIVFGITFLLGAFIGGPFHRRPLGTALNLPATFFSVGFALILFIYNLRLWFRHPCHTPALLKWSILGNIGLALVLGTHLPQEASWLSWLLLSLYSVVSSLLLGSGVLAMLLGHRYLTDPALSILPLKQLSQIFMGLVFLQSGWAIIHLIAFMPHEQMMNALQIKTFEGVYLWIRLAIGLIGPMILTPMILRTVAERATMSATGLLYIAMLMAIIGALFSHFFLFIYGNLI